MKIEYISIKKTEDGLKPLFHKAIFTTKSGKEIIGSIDDAEDIKVSVTATKQERVLVGALLMTDWNAKEEVLKETNDRFLKEYGTTISEISKLLKH